jgi:hypothetical protein
MKHFLFLIVLNGVNRRSVDNKNNRKKRIICQHCLIIVENKTMVHTTATTAHIHYDLEKPGYRGTLLASKFLFN